MYNEKNRYMRWVFIHFVVSRVQSGRPHVPFNQSVAPILHYFRCSQRADGSASTVRLIVEENAQVLFCCLHHWGTCCPQHWVGPMSWCRFHVRCVKASPCLSALPHSSRVRLCWWEKCLSSVTCSYIRLHSVSFGRFR